MVFFSLSTSMPSRKIVPLSGSCRVATVRMRVDFPAPFGPSRPNILLPMLRERFLRAFTPFGYVFDSPVIVSAKWTPLLCGTDVALYGQRDRWSKVQPAYNERPESGLDFCQRHRQIAGFADRKGIRGRP